MRLTGKMRQYRCCTGLLVWFFVAWTLVACGGSKNHSSLPSEGDEINIDQLLGIESGEPEAVPAGSAADTSSSEDEVLRLLGITKDETRPSSTQPDAAQSETERLREEINKLQTDLFEKDNLIQELRRELNQKNQRLAELQTRALAASTQPAIRPSSTAMRSMSGGSTRDRYQRALAEYNAGRYKNAIEMFSALLAENIESNLADNCQYWIGECYYGLKNYTQAIAEFEKVFRYPDTNKADAALLKLGLTYMKLNDVNSARTQFELLIANHPKSEYVERARRYLSKL